MSQKRVRDLSDLLVVDDESPSTKKRKVDPRGCNWFMTWNNNPKDWKDLIKAIGGLTKYCCQPEVGKEGTPHIQGVLVFSFQKLRSTLYNALPGVYMRKAWNLFACKNYCSKLDTRAGDIWVHGFEIVVPLIDPLDGKTLHKWQQDILDIVNGPPDNRKVLWFWSDVGNIGKSALCKHMCLKVSGCFVLGGRFKDAMFAIDRMVNVDKSPPKILVFDVPRSMIKDGNVMVSYHTMEKIKDGCFFSSKYKAAQVLFNPCHVLVFANAPPDLSQLSSDRWVVKCLDPPVQFNFNTDKAAGRLINKNHYL